MSCLGGWGVEQSTALLGKRALWLSSPDFEGQVMSSVPFCSHGNKIRPLPTPELGRGDVKWLGRWLQLPSLLFSLIPSGNHGTWHQEQSLKMFIPQWAEVRDATTSRRQLPAQGSLVLGVGGLHLSTAGFLGSNPSSNMWTKLGQLTSCLFTAPTWFGHHRHHHIIIELALCESHRSGREPL